MELRRATWWLKVSYMKNTKKVRQKEKADVRNSGKIEVMRKIRCFSMVQREKEKVKMKHLRTRLKIRTSTNYEAMERIF